ncbi:DNA (cytosine-5-)-methyltransferase [Brevundimonas diminuta]|uniref:Cytosine-specific methyltransferase n=1 Tax=Brevundimonas diminuta TaxID=293 RepID=A0A1Z3LTK3_BREDI|nr:DNA (cytosine-5-)-methyltransferase [Brevundimonas diminuta]
MYVGSDSIVTDVCGDVDTQITAACPTSAANDPVVVDLFAGAGGFSAGAIDAGFRIAGAIEFDKHAASTYRANIKSSDGKPVVVVDDDILTISPESARTRWALEPGQCDLIIGGPPCQGFSTHRIKDAGVGDPRNKLLKRYFEFVGHLRPRAFVVENVPGLTWARHKPFLDEFLKLANAANYDVGDPRIINAADYGVPQSRKRVFILGVDRRRPLDLAWPPEPTHRAPHRTEDAGAPWRTCENVFRPARKGDPLDIHMNSGPALVAVFASTPANGGSRSESSRILPCHAAHNGHKDVYGRIDPKKPAPTMTTACINPSKGRFVHPTEHHGITARQAARIQTFPDTYEFIGGLTAAGRQIGNAVPVDLAAALLRPIAAAIKAAKAAEAAANRN